MAVATPRIAQFLGLSEAELMQKALRSLLLEQKRAVLQTRLEILARYRAIDIADLEKKISDGTVAEHPAWEDLITAENLRARVEEIVELCMSLERDVIAHGTAAVAAIML